MGPLKGLLQMIPGASELPNFDKSEGEFEKIEAIILSMTPGERLEKVELVPSRRWRIAKGSGTSVDDVNRSVKGFKKMKELLKHLPKKGSFDPSGLKKMGSFFG
jgi:signal recognition particle subunit SRP54